MRPYWLGGVCHGLMAGPECWQGVGEASRSGNGEPALTETRRSGVSGERGRLTYLFPLDGRWHWLPGFPRGSCLPHHPRVQSLPVNLLLPHLGPGAEEQWARAHLSCCASELGGQLGSIWQVKCQSLFRLAKLDGVRRRCSAHNGLTWACSRDLLPLGLGLGSSGQNRWDPEGISRLTLSSLHTGVAWPVSAGRPSPRLPCIHLSSPPHSFLLIYL